MGQEQSVQSARGSDSEHDIPPPKDDTPPRKASLTDTDEIQSEQESVNDHGLKSYNFLVKDDPLIDEIANDDVPASRSAAQEVKNHDQQKDEFSHSLEERAMTINFGDDEGQQDRYVNQFGEMSRATSYKLFRGGNGSVNSLSSLAQFSSSEHGSASVYDTVIDAADKDEATTDYSTGEMKEVAKQDVLNQFGCVQRVESCVLFGEMEEVAKKTDEAAERTREHKDVDETQGEKIMINFGDDEETKDDKLKGKGRYINQFGEISRSTSYKMLRGGTGSVTSLSSLNQFGGSELGSSLGSVCELNILEHNEQNDGKLAGPGPDTRHAPVTSVVNQFGCIARVESAALFRTESATSFALSLATESVADSEDVDGDFF